MLTLDLFGPNTQNFVLHFLIFCSHLAPHGGLHITSVGDYCRLCLDWINQSQVSLSGKLYSMTPSDELGQVFCVHKGIVTFFFLLINKSNFQKLYNNPRDI